MIPKKKKVINHGEVMQLDYFEVNMCPDPEKDPYEGSPYTEWLDRPRNGKRRRR